MITAAKFLFSCSTRSIPKTATYNYRPSISISSILFTIKKSVKQVLAERWFLVRLWDFLHKFLHYQSYTMYIVIGRRRLCL